jgi:hypothetical protein
MAITRTQIARQLYKDGKRVGLRGGMDAAQSDFGNENFGGNNKGDGGGDRDRIQQEKQREFQQQQLADLASRTFDQGDTSLDVKAPERNLGKDIATRLLIGALPAPVGLAYTAYKLAPTSYQERIKTALKGKPKTIDDDEDDIPGGDGDGNTMIAQTPISPYQTDLIQQNVVEEPQGIIAQLIAQRELEGGPRRFAAGGGIMNSSIIGGLADGSMDEMGRQMYGLGKLVKKASRAVKKLVKSPIGAAAVASFIPFGPKGDKTTLFKKFMDSNIGQGIGDYFANMETGDKLALAASAGLTAAPFLFQEEEEEPDFVGERGPGLDIAGIRANPTPYLSRRFRAEGGSTEGKEPVAKKTMPLLDMDGMEKDYRETGGFVEMGRMEKADDVPARLSKNEFVFTADAVRNAGDGDVDKGAEVMYNMMKNLEAGGDVSEESQGLEGARNMFQTSKRLEEVL